MRKSLGKNISKILSSKCSQKLLNHARQSATDTFKTASKKAIQKTEGITDNKIVHKTTKVTRNSLQNNSETVTNETENTGLDREIAKERNIIIPKIIMLIKM